MPGLKKIDWSLLFFSLLLSIIGLLILYSFSLYSGDYSLFSKQSILLLFGFLISVLLSFVDIRALKKGSVFIFTVYILSIILLVGLFLFATVIRGTRSWYVLGAFTLEPVEITKIIFILLFAKFFSQRHIELYQVGHIILAAIYAFLPAVLVFFQPDFGSAMILILLWLSMMLVAGIKRKHLIVILVVGLIAMTISWNFILTGEQKERFIAFLNPYLDPTGSGYHILQSIITVGSGGFFGKGFLNPLTQAKLGFLPEANTDFIFASFSEIFGLIGVLFLFLIFALLFWRLFLALKTCKDNFSRLLVSGFITLIGIEIFINIAMNVGFLPITGTPLPFLSYGGSSLLSLFIGVGLVQSVIVHSEV